MRSSEQGVHFTINPSLKFISISTIISGDAIGLEGENLYREKEYVKALNEFNKKNYRSPKNWDEELSAKEYIDAPLHQYDQSISLSLQKTRTKIRRMFYAQIATASIGLALLVRASEISFLLQKVHLFFAAPMLPIILRVTGIVSGTAAITWFVWLVRNKSLVYNKKLVEEKEHLKKIILKETEEQKQRKEALIQSEKERSHLITKMLSRDPETTIFFLSRELKKSTLPFSLEGFISWKNGDVLSLNFILPQKSIIPLYLREKKKKKREKLIDEQYLDVIARLLVLIVNLTYQTIPWLNHLQIHAKEPENNPYKQEIDLMLTRDHFKLMNWNYDNPFLQLKHVPELKIELAIDKRISITDMLKKEDKKDTPPELEIGE